MLTGRVSSIISPPSSLRGARSCSGSVSLSTVVLVMGILRIELTDNWTEYFDDRYAFRRDTDFVIENLTGMESLEYSLNAGREGGITDPGYLP